MKGSRILFEKIDKAEKNNELIELHSHILIDITCLKKIIDFLLWKRNLQFMETSSQFFMIYCTIWILVYEEKTINLNLQQVSEGRSKIQHELQASDDEFLVIWIERDQLHWNIVMEARISPVYHLFLSGELGPWKILRKEIFFETKLNA